VNTPAQVAPVEHALLSPSSAYTWIECAASIAAQQGQPEESSEYADDGTASHELARWCLELNTDAHSYIGEVIKVGDREFEVDDERAEFVQLYVGAVRDRVAALELAGASVTLRVEERLSIEHITGETAARGTSDVVILAEFPDGHFELEVRDLKYGRGVEVEAELNYQAMIYAEGARHEYEPVADIGALPDDRIRLVIHQPRVNPVPSEWELAPADLRSWIDTIARPAAQDARILIGQPLSPGDFNPGEKQCRFCKAKAVCPALAAHVENVIGRDFEALTDGEGLFNVDLLANQNLGTIYQSLDLIDSWMKAVRGRIEAELLLGHAVPGTKLVQGRRGARQWESSDDAEKLLKSMRLKQEQMYNFKLISPTQAEKLLARDSPRRWKKVEAMVTQRDGAPSVAAESDKRPALVIAPPEDDFEPVVPDDGGYLT
jgi:hypothetical protein